MKQGVGKETELKILSDGYINSLSKEKMEILNNVYQKELEYGKNQQVIKDLCPGELVK